MSVGASFNKKPMANSDKAQQKLRVVLKQIFGEKINEEYNLTGSEASIGRSPKCEIRLSCVNVSRKHCILTHSNDGWRIMDNKSRNGTYINGRQLNPGERFLLQYGDIVFLGPPSEMPQAFSYEEHQEEPMETDEDDDDDSDIIELPIKRTWQQNTGYSPKKTVKKFIQNPDIEILESQNHKEYELSVSVSESHSKDLFNSNANTKLDIIEISKNITPIKKSLNSESSASNFKDCSDEISTAGSDQGGNSESLLDDGVSGLIDPIPSYCPEELWELDTSKTHKKTKSRNSTKSKELENKLALLSEQIKKLQDSKLELLKNYEDVCEKNKVLDQQLSDKQKKLEEELKQHEVKAKNEVKSELLEKLEEDLVCNICTELFIKPTVLDCSHTFCEYCIKEWRKKKNDCPICRCKIKNVTRVRTLEEFIDKTLTTLTPEQRVKRDNVLAQRTLAEQPPKPAQTTPRRRRGGRTRRSRYVRPSTYGADTSVQILEESIPSTLSRSSRSGNRPGDELSIQVNLTDLPVFRFFFS